MTFIRLVGALLTQILPGVLRSLSGLGRLPHRTVRLSAVLILAAALAIGWLFLESFYGIVIGAGSRPYDRPEIVVSVAVLLSWLMCLFAGASPAREQASRAVENELWRSLPVRPVVRSLVRFTALLLLVLPLHLYFYLPALAVYLRAVQPDARVIAGVAACALLPPVVPVALDLALALVLRRLPRYSRRALVLESAIPVALLLLIAGGQVFLARSLFSTARSDELAASIQALALLRPLESSLPPLHWLASTLKPGREVPAMLVSLGFAAAVAVPVIAWAARVPPALEYERARARRPGTGSRVLGGWLTRPLPALVSREAALFFASRPLVFEAVLRLLVLPSFLILYAAGGPPELTAILTAFIAWSPAAAVFAVCLLLFLVDISFLAATGLSREERTIDLSRALPWDPRTQGKAKTIFLLCLSLPPAAAALALVYALFPIPPDSLVCAVPGTAAYLVFSILIGLLFDYRRPVFASAGPAFRQNANTVLAVAVAAAVLTAGGATAFAAVSLGLSPLASAFLVVQLLIGVDILLWPRLLRAVDRQAGAGGH